MNTRKRLFTALLLAAVLSLALALPAHADTWICRECGYAGNRYIYCDRCGLSRAQSDAATGASNSSWVCCECGFTGNRYNFCGVCGLSRAQNEALLRSAQSTQTVQRTPTPWYATSAYATSTYNWQNHSAWTTPMPTLNNRPLFRIEIDVGSGNVRNAPSFGGEKIDVVVARERFDVFEVVHDVNNCFWYRIKLGWIHSGITTLKVPDLTQSYGSTPAPTAPRY